MKIDGTIHLRSSKPAQFRTVGRFENPGANSNVDRHNLLPPIEISLTDLSKLGVRGTRRPAGQRNFLVSGQRKTGQEQKSWDKMH